MTQLYLIGVAIVVLLVTRRIYQKNIELFLLILLISNFEFFGLIKAIRFSSNLRLMIMPIIISIFVEMIMMKKKMTIGKYGGWVILFFVIVINGVLISALAGQPIIIGIKGVKFYSLMMIYFFIVNHEINIDKFIKYLMILALIIAGMAALQYISKSQIYIFETHDSALRSSRIGTGSLVISIAAISAFINFLKKKGQYYLYGFLVFLIHMLFVIQSRMLLAGVVLTCILVYFLFYRFSLKAISVFIVLSLVLSMGVIPFVPYNELSVVKQTMTDFDKDEETLSSYDARLVTFEYYIDKIQKSPIFGTGFQSVVWRGNEEILLQKKGIHLSDIGIMDFIIKTGLVGLIWLLAGLTRFLISMVKEEELLLAGSYILLGLTTLATIDLYVSGNAIFMFGLFVGLLANESAKKDSRMRLVSNKGSL